MARSQLMREHFSGFADDRAEALTDPRVLIAHPLYRPRPNEPRLTLARWELPSDPGEHPSADEFQRLVRARKAFVVGGCQFVVEMGLVADWYRDGSVRRETLQLLQDRGLLPLLEELAFKENSGEEGARSALLGKTATSRYISSLPRLKRDRPDTRRWRPLSNRDLYFTHPLRLRKAIEFITMTEVVVRRRLRRLKSQGRFNAFTGLAGADENNALFVWDHLWIEPIIFVVDPEPRRPDIHNMIDDERIARRFEQESGQPRGALSWILLGVPGKLRSVEAAAAARNSYYGENATQTQAVTVPPAEFKRRMAILFRDREFAAHVDAIENIWSLGPEENSGP